MKNKKLLALLLAVVLLVTQFSMLSVVSAETTALSGRETSFDFGVNVHCPQGYAAYISKQYTTILDAKALGANLIRINSNAAYTAGYAALAAEHGIDVMLVKDDFNKKLASTEIDYQAIYDEFYSTATALKDHVKYIQIGNELDNAYIISGDGSTTSQYNDVTAAAIGVYAANKAIKDANAANNSNIKTVLNFSWKHYGFFEALKAVTIDTDNYTVATDTSTNTAVVDWDIIGADIYSDMGTVYETVFPIVEEKFGKQIIVCESGLWSKDENGDGEPEYIGDAAWLETFVRYCYADTNVIGFIPYELYDEPAFTPADGTFNRESHFGLIDKDGNKKDTYNTICALYGGTGDVGDRTITAAPAINNVNTLKTTFLSGSVEGVVPSNFNNKIINTGVLTATDFSQGNFIEFDLYVEDASALKNALLRNDLSLQTVLVDSSENEVFSNDITGETALVDGWNHIVLSRGSFHTESGVAGTQGAFSYYKDVTQFGLRVKTDVDTYTELSGMNIAVANVCSTIDEIATAPAYPENAVVEVSKDGVTHTYGDQYNWTRDQLVINKSSNPVDLSKVLQVEFDIYIENNEAFQTAAKEGTFIFYLSSDDSKYKNRRKYPSFANQITKDGWNHVVINLSDGANSDGTLDLTTVKYVYVGYDGNNGVTHPFGATMVRVANICGTYDTTISSEYETVLYATGTGTDGDLVLVQPDSNTNFTRTFLASPSRAWHNQYSVRRIKQYDDEGNATYPDSTPADFTGCTEFTFKMYIDNAEAYDQWREHMLFFMYDKNGNVAFYPCPAGLVAGWNTITLDFDVFTKQINSASENIDISNIMRFGVYTVHKDQAYWGNKNDLSLRTGYNQNVCYSNANFSNLTLALRDMYGIKAERANNADELFIDSGTYSYWGKGANNFNYCRISIPFTSVDVSAYDYIEFDIYISDVEALSNEKLSDGTTAHWTDTVVRLNSLTTHGRSYRPNTLKTGLNHIKVPVSALPDATDFSSLYCYLENFGATATPDQRYSIGLVNIKATRAEISRVPEYPDDTVVEILKDSGKITVSGAFNALNDKSLRNFDAANISNVLQVEFDIYIENYESYADKTLRINLASSQNASGAETTSRWTNRVAYNFYDQLTGDGWNHIVIPVNSFYTVAGSINYSSIAWMYITTESTATATAAQMRIANLCGTVDATIPSDIETVLYATGTGTDDGLVLVQPDSNTNFTRTFLASPSRAWHNQYSVRRIKNESGSIVDSTPADFTGCTEFTFKMYIDNAEAYDQWREHMLFFMYDKNGNVAFYPCPAGLVSGWNTITLDFDIITEQTSNIDISNIMRFGVYTVENGKSYWGTNDVHLRTGYNQNVCYSNASFPNLTLALRNMYGIKGERTKTAEELFIDAGRYGYWGNGAINFNYSKVTVPFTSVDVSAYDYIEFDIYISDAEALRNEKLSDGTTAQWTDTVVRLNSLAAYGHSFKPATLKTGLNHVKIPVSKLPDATDFSSLYLYLENSGATGTPDQRYSFGIVNVKATTAEINRVPKYPDYAMVEILKDSEILTLNWNYDYMADQTTKNFEAVDVSIVEQVEFDIYIENYESYKDKELRFNLASSVNASGEAAANKYTNRVGYSFYDQLTGDGWNHIVIPVSSFTTVSGSINYSSIAWMYLSSESDDNRTSAQMRVANLCGAMEGGIRIPTDVMTDKVDFIGATLKPVKFDESGMYTLEVSADISATRMIELDVYVIDSTVTNTITVYLMDSDGNIISYTFEGLTDGWNHCAVRIADTEGEATLTDIVTLALEGTAEAQVFVSNCYAADYVDGDANRDGKLDLRDVVRAKKLSVGITTEGNVLAVSDKGANTYAIEAEDLAAVNKTVLAALFKK